jgi:hypothetical protein
MTCNICNHDNPKNPEEVHANGACPQCNCGESEIRHYQRNPRQFVPDYSNNLLAWGERLSHFMRPSTRFRRSVDTHTYS